MAGVRQFDENRVVDAALNVFWRKGLRETTMQDLAAAAHVQRGSLYNAYGDKETLFLLAFDRYAMRFIDAARTALSSANGAEALAAFFEVAIANMTSGIPPRGCLTTRTALDAIVSSDPVCKRVRALLKDLEMTLRDAFSRGDMEGSLAIESHRAALIVVTFTRGLAVMERAFQDKAQLREAAGALVAALFPAGAKELGQLPRRPRGSRGR
jgi:TetR/AcrR family transcriptional repressor of nem operon